MSNIQYAIFGVLFISIMSTSGAAIVFIFKKNLSDFYNKLFLGFAGGVMLAASIWSLILPALEYPYGIFSATIGLILGCLFIFLIDLLFTKNNDHTKCKKLFIAMTVHNIPEGFAVGVAFGLALNSNDPVAIVSALAIAIAIGIQNLPESMALALPIKQEKQSSIKGFLFGMTSGAVEPISAIIGIVLVSVIYPLMPWALSFAAGAMIYVVITEVIPETKKNNFAIWMFILGFTIMMILDVVLG